MPETETNRSEFHRNQSRGGSEGGMVKIGSSGRKMLASLA